MPQTAIAFLLMRGGTSKGPFFRAQDLPADIALRDKVLLGHDIVRWAEVIRRAKIEPQ